MQTHGPPGTVTDGDPGALRVLHLTNLLFAGGAELHLLSLAEGLRRRGVRVTVASLAAPERWRNRPLAPEFERAGVEVLGPAGEARAPWALAPRMAVLLRRVRPHLLHTHLAWADLVGAAAALAVPGTTRICTVHDLTRSHAPEYPVLPVVRTAWGRARGVIAISEAVGDWLVRKQGIRANRLRVVPYGVDPAAFERPATELREPLGVKGRPVVGTIARLEPRKGQDTLIRAMTSVAAEMPEARLLLAGHDPAGHGEALRTLCSGLGLEGVVRFVGFQQDVPSFLHAIDVFAFASRSEGFGQVLIEAMAAGKPVVASRIPPLTEIVVDGETGLLVEPGDSAGFGRAVCRLLAHPEEARRMGMNGRERVHRRFAVDRMVDDTLAFYRELLGSGQRP